MKKEQVYYSWLLRNQLKDTSDGVEVEKVYNTKAEAMAAFVEWGPTDETSAVMVEVKIKPVSKLVIGGVKEVPLD